MPQTRALWRRLVLRDARLLTVILLSAAVFFYEAGISSAAGQRMHVIHYVFGYDLLLIFSGGLTLVSFGLAMWRIGVQRWEGVRRSASEALIRQLAFEDPLTGLPNRRQFETALQKAVSSPEPETSHALLLLDLNGFKTINDVYGHNTGDALIRIVANRLADASRGGDMVARIGGDEFAILAHRVRGEEAVQLAERIMAHLADPVALARVRHHVQTGIGVAVFPFAGATVEEVLRRADLALYRAKAQTGSAIRCYDDAMDVEVRRREQLEVALRIAIDEKRVRLHYQPIVDLKSEEIVGFEALARWTDAELGAVSPDVFMPAAEDIGLIRDLTEHLLTTACRAARAWPDHIRLAFNVSPVQLRDPELASQILAILAHHQWPAHRLELEVTEEALMRDDEVTLGILGSLKAAGVQIALDDFGTGYSSLLLLQRLRPDILKIDRRFVAPIQGHPQSRAIVAAVVALGHSLGLAVTAEGVETPAQSLHLLQHRCDRAQGYLFGRPLDERATLSLLQSACAVRPKHAAWGRALPRRDAGPRGYSAT